jgi:predicted DsbA family dithiol-disulfide isomerase
MAPITVDVWSDLVCPWCYIGKRRLSRALEQEPAGSVEVRWHAFQLQPDIPVEGVEAETYFNGKFGGPERVAVSGAQAPDILRQLLAEARQREAAA